MERITGLWKNKTKTGETYLAGSFLNVRIVILPNKDKKANNEPDYTLFLTPKEQKKEESTVEMQVVTQEEL